MQLETFGFVNGTWSSAFPDLDSERTLVVVFAAPSFGDNAAPLSAMLEAFPRSAVIGCSTSGEIAQTSVRDESISVAAIKFDHVRIRHAHARLAANTDSFAAGIAIADQLVADDLRAVLVLSEGLHVNGSELVRDSHARGSCSKENRSQTRWSRSDSTALLSRSGTGPRAAGTRSATSVS